MPAKPRVRIPSVLEPKGVERGDLMGPDRRAVAGDAVALPDVVDGGRYGPAEPREVPKGCGGDPEVEFRLPLREPRQDASRDPENRRCSQQFA